MNFNKKLFHKLVGYAMAAYLDGRIVFTFHNGVEIGCC